jgi:hypothetical protein
MSFSTARRICRERRPCFMALMLPFGAPELGRGPPGARDVIKIEHPERGDPSGASWPAA